MELYGYENQSVEGVHKKINLAEPFLAWEHERFSMKRIAAFTLSSLKVSSGILSEKLILNYILIDRPTPIPSVQPSSANTPQHPHCNPTVS
jgi:hypothetical protein